MTPRAKPNKKEKAMAMKNEAPEVETQEEAKGKKKKYWEINRMHQVFNHAGEEALRRTAKAYGWELTGNLDPCVYCKTANAKQKDVPKTSETQSEIPGERIFMDIASIKTTTMGGAKFWLLLVDDATGMAWSKLLKKKSDTARELMAFMRQMKQHGSPVKFVRCDNAGENKDPHNKCKESSDLTDVKFLVQRVATVALKPANTTI